jgi:hypothetical protein
MDTMLPPAPQWLATGDTMSIVALVGIAGALAVLVFERGAGRRGLDGTKQRPEHRWERHLPPARVRQFGRWPTEAAEAPPERASRRSWSRTLRAVSLAVVTPLLEKNVIKTCSTEVPMVFSMSRVVVLAFAVGILRQIWHAGIAGWPEATLAMAVVLALPVLGAMERVAPERVVELAKSLVGRFGSGGVRDAGIERQMEAGEPSRYDDHRRD